MKKILAGTIAISSVLSNSVLATESIAPNPINIDIDETQQQVVRPLISIQPIEIAETSNVVLSYMPKPINDNILVSEMEVVSNNLGTPTKVWNITFVNNEDIEAPIGVIEEYPKSLIDTSTINTDIYDVFEADTHVYIAKVDDSRKLYFPENSIDATVLDQYKDNLINFLDPYKIDATDKIEGINSQFLVKTPNGIALLAYNTKTYDTQDLDEFTFFYSPISSTERPQQIMDIISTTVDLDEEYTLLKEGAYKIYSRTYSEHNLTSEIDIEQFNNALNVLSNENLMKDHVQLPQIEDTTQTDFTNVLIINGYFTGINYIKTDDNQILIPLRETFEHLDYEVLWNEETKSIDLVNGPIFTSLTIGEDEYYFGRQQATQLGIPPVIIEEKTYIPLEFLSEVLPYDAMKLSNGQINIITQE